MQYPEKFRYTENHEWLEQQGNECRIGITDYAQEELGDVVFVELPEVGESFAAGNPFAVVESVKTASDIYMPIGGKILAVNEALRDKPELVNQSPYENGWMVRVEPDNPDEIELLLDVTTYQERTGA